MCVGNTMAENKQHLKKSIAKMMVFWVVHSRHNLRADLLAKNPNDKWADLDFKKAFADSPDESFEQFFERAADLFLDNKAVNDGAEIINARVDGKDELVDKQTGKALKAEWCPFLVEFCPDNRIINVMFNAAMAFVDNTDWEGNTAVSQKLAQQSAKRGPQAAE